MRKLSLGHVIVLISIFGAGCRVPDYTINVGGNDLSYQNTKALTYDGVTTLFLLNGSTNNSKAYSLETIDITNGNRTLVAGTQSSASTDGIGTNAAFSAPRAMAYKSGSPGYLYIGDNCVIRRVNTSTWQVETIAGSNASCTDTDGTGTASARFNSVNALEVSGSNLYIGTQNKIRKMDLGTLVVTTLAGNAVAGYVDDIGANAKFNRISDIKLIGGFLYVLDATNQRIRQVNLANNSVTTLAGSTSGYADGIGAAAKFNFSANSFSKMTNDGVKFLFVSDSTNGVIRKVDVTTGEVSSIYPRGGSTGQFDQDGNLGAANVSSYFLTGISLTPYGLFIANDWGVRVLR